MNYLNTTRLLDFDGNEFTILFNERGWTELEEADRIGKIYNFVRDEIVFGYNSADDIPASQVLRDGYGQCNTKGILLMALLRRAGISCRFHGFTIDKTLQKGAITGIWYKLSPQSIVHSWVEVLHKGTWYNLEGFIIDRKYLGTIQRNNPDASNFCGFGIATTNLKAPQIEWEISNTYIQKEGINADFGVYDDPDTFFAEHRQQLGLVKQLMFRRIVRHIMNRTVARLRNQG